MSVKHFIFTAEDCPRCEKQKAEWDKAAIRYEERDSSRIKTPTEDHDEVDREGFVSLAQNNMQLPAIVILEKFEVLRDGEIVTE